MVEKGPRTELVWLSAAAVLVAVLGGAFLLDRALTDGGNENGPGASDSRFPIVVQILSPAQDATLSGPVTLKVASSGVEIAPPEAGVAGAAHYHAFVNVIPFTPGGKPIPTDDARIHHFATDSLELDLPPGVYTVVVALGDNDEIRLTNATVDAVDLVVR